MTFTETYERWRSPLADALDPRYHNIEWLDWMVISGRAYFWASDKAAAVAELRYYPTGAKDVHGIAAAGDLREIIDKLIPLIFEWGRSMGCMAMMVDSRQGWTRILKQQGFDLYKTAIRKAY